MVFFQIGFESSWFVAASVFYDVVACTDFEMLHSMRIVGVESI